MQIGHLEQFNPAIRKLRKSTCKPQFIEVHRLCQFNPRANDVDVVLDLMIHDIDIVLSLVNKKIEKVSPHASNSKYDAYKCGLSGAEKRTC